MGFCSLYISKWEVNTALLRYSLGDRSVCRALLVVVRGTCILCIFYMRYEYPFLGLLYEYMFTFARDIPRIV